MSNMYSEAYHQIASNTVYGKCMNTYFELADVLRGRGMRNAFDGGELTAVIYISFLKFLSDRRDVLGLKCSDNFRYEALCKLYPDVIGQNDLLHYLIEVEEQLGFSHGVLGTLLFPRQSREFDETFRVALEVGQRLDFGVGDIGDAYVQGLVAVVEKLAVKMGKAGGINYTPCVLGRFMKRLLQMTDGMSLYDPCAGIGLLLAEAMEGHDVDVFAQEIHASTAAILEILLVMSGMRRGRISCNDSAWNPLSYELDCKFDRIICDPPYVKPETGYRNITNSLLRDHILYYPEEKIEEPWIFVRHIAAALKPKGRAVVILPMSMMTREGPAGKIRQRLIEDGYIDSVIELPSGTYPFTAVKTSILVIEKGAPKHDVYFLNLSTGKWDGKSECDARYAEMVNGHEILAGTSALVSIEKFADNGFQLVASRYVSQPIDMEQFISDSVRLYDNAKIMEERFRKLCSEFNDELMDYNGYLNEC